MSCYLSLTINLCFYRSIITHSEANILDCGILSFSLQLMVAKGSKVVENVNDVKPIMGLILLTTQKTAKHFLRSVRHLKKCNPTDLNIPDTTFSLAR